MTSGGVHVGMIGFGARRLFLRPRTRRPAGGPDTWTSEGQQSGQRPERSGPAAVAVHVSVRRVHPRGDVGGAWSEAGVVAGSGIVRLGCNPGAAKTGDRATDNREFPLRAPVPTFFSHSHTAVSAVFEPGPLWGR